MKRIFLLITAAVAAAAITGCYESKLNETDHPTEGKIVIEVALPTTDDGEVLTGDYYVVINGEVLPVDDNGQVQFPDTYEVGTYTAYVYNVPESTTVDATAADVVIAAVDETGVVGIIDGTPGLLYFGTQTFEITADSVTASEVTLVQITCEVNFELELEGTSMDRISNITAMLDGVVQQWDCVNDLPYGSSNSLSPELTQGTTTATSTVKNRVTRADGEEIEVLQGTVYILGVHPDSEQKLTITLEYEDDNPTSHTAKSDITELLNEVNGNKTTAVTMTGTMSTPINSVTGGAIIDWNDTLQGDVTIK